ncbi:cytotoxic T-lymphocyte protein 4 [Toxotes jaculatrix]|uniref:cytotoxic T-lymphocyte protein 4 n=1 Tax=Toxotes jaculatrix TaxID=941984 RepID=UPI001B3AB503|nr:cytotoxic T-lymphocyte protein 4 [Toxotes jaculatrix]XP_040913412.1 cytotoxic T-lymphocyte protein 4 [Toxotes jaculatrix]
MVLTNCMMGLTVLTVLSLCLPVWSAVKVTQPYRVVSINGTAQVQCFIHPQPFYDQIQHSHDQNPPYPFPVPEEVHVILLKGLYGTQELCSHTINLTEHRETSVESNGESQCSATLREGAVEVTVSGLKATDTDIYRCEIGVIYPPPYLRLTGNGTLIHVIESSDCPLQGARTDIAHQGDDEENDEGDEKMAPVSFPVIVLVIMIMLVLLIIIYFQTVQCVRGKREIIRAVPGGPYKVDAVPFSCKTVV